MKRIVICSILFAGIIAVSIFSYSTVKRVDSEITNKINAITTAINQDDVNLLILQVTELNLYWQKEEKILVHFIRHSHIDSITVSMARLPALAQYGDISEVNAELASIRIQIEHIHTSEKLNLYNLF